MTDPTPADQQQEKNSKVQALALLLEQAGIDPEDVAPALMAFATAKQATAPLPKKDKRIYQEKELIYDDESSFIFKRGDTKGGWYYLRVYDPISKIPFIKSLKTKDRIKAIASARTIYQDVKGKIERGDRLRTITTEELVKLYLEKESKKITDIPKEGITSGRYRTKNYFLGIWLDYIAELGCANTPINKIRPERSREFGYWFKARPRQNDPHNKTPYSINMINSCISEIKRMYKQVAVRDRYIGIDQIPEIDALRESPDKSGARDVFSTDEYNQFWMYCIHKYIKEKGITYDEKQKRIIFYNAIGILMNSGLRPKELLGLKVNELTFLPNDTEDQKAERMKITIRRTNSKTGVGRVVVCPITKRVNKIKQAYKALGVNQLPTDVLFMNPSSPSRSSYTREIISKRLRNVLAQSGIQDQLDKNNKRINLYSTRHTYITWRLRYGNTPIHLLARAVGTSVDLIQKRYSHIKVEQQADLLTRAQGFAKASDVDLGNNQFWINE